MGFKFWRSRAVKVVMASTLAVFAAGGLLIGATDVGAASLQRGTVARGACIRQILSGERTRSTLDALVQDGTLTAEQEQVIVAKLLGQVTDGKPCAGFGLLRDHSVGDAVANELGMTRSEIRKAWVGGQSLAEIAQSKSVSRDELIQTIDTAIDQRLQKAVDKGRITSERKSEIMTELTPRIEQAVDAHRGDSDTMNGGTPEAPATSATPAASSATTATL